MQSRFAKNGDRQVIHRSCRTWSRQSAFRSASILSSALERLIPFPVFEESCRRLTRVIASTIVACSKLDPFIVIEAIGTLHRLCACRGPIDVPISIARATQTNFEHIRVVDHQFVAPVFPHSGRTTRKAKETADSSCILY